eukprot:TRINITY_DN2182_c1_g1_i1.p2 TRINITY_DN2182_c1_g1~~TRINITY_DN2182_c1_g1_i1.p2  ORF type:complete len:58 (+),score=8.93 TRINITY_DN2182_c1_g1_i1:468-641(+)
MLKKRLPDVNASELPPSLDAKSLSAYGGTSNLKKPDNLIKKQASVIGYLENRVKISK